jgi:hypothetical protein
MRAKEREKKTQFGVLIKETVRTQGLGGDDDCERPMSQSGYFRLPDGMNPRKSKSVKRHYEQDLQQQEGDSVLTPIQCHPSGGMTSGASDLPIPLPRMSGRNLQDRGHRCFQVEISPLIHSHRQKLSCELTLTPRQRIGEINSLGGGCNR